MYQLFVSNPVGDEKEYFLRRRWRSAIARGRNDVVDGRKNIIEIGIGIAGVILVGNRHQVDIRRRRLRARETGRQRKDFRQAGAAGGRTERIAVSYTHLTLPTKRIV